MDIGFIGLGNMGFPMAGRILAAGHRVVVFDTQPAAVDRAVALGREAATLTQDVADRTDTVMASLPSLQASADVAIGSNGVAGRQARRFIDLSTIGSQVAQHNHACLAERGFATLDAPSAAGSTAPDGHPRDHGVGATKRLRRDAAGLRDHRARHLHQRETRCRADDEVGEQPHGRDHARSHRRGDGDGRQGGSGRQTS